MCGIFRTWRSERERIAVPICGSGSSISPMDEIARSRSGVDQSTPPSSNDKSKRTRRRNPNETQRRKTFLSRDVFVVLKCVQSSVPCCIDLLCIFVSVSHPLSAQSRFDSQENAFNVEVPTKSSLFFPGSPRAGFDVSVVRDRQRRILLSLAKKTVGSSKGDFCARDGTKGKKK